MLGKYIRVKPRLGEVAHLRSVSCSQACQAGFASFRFPLEVIMAAVRWYLRNGLVLP